MCVRVCACVCVCACVRFARGVVACFVLRFLFELFSRTISFNYLYRLKEASDTLLTAYTGICSSAIQISLSNWQIRIRLKLKRIWFSYLIISLTKLSFCNRGGGIDYCNKHEFKNRCFPFLFLRTCVANKP